MPFWLRFSYVFVGAVFVIWSLVAIGFGAYVFQRHEVNIYLQITYIGLGIFVLGGGFSFVNTGLNSKERK